MRIGYCSPFSPLKSGISDFSEELVLALSRYMEIIIFSPVEIENRDIVSRFETHRVAELDDAGLRNRLDLIVYHIGNNMIYHGEIADMLMKYPGVLELHDFGLHHLAAEKYFLGQGGEAYLEEVKYCHGSYGEKIALQFLNGQARAPWETHALDLCMNKRYIDKSLAAIVHSEAAKQMTLGFRPELPIVNIMLHSEIVKDADQWMKKCRNKLGIPPHQLVMGSFGFATSSKRIIPILDALKKYWDNQDKSFIYYIVGEPQKELSLSEEVEHRGLGGNIRITGFTSLDDFKVYMGACNFCVNLRYPTQGESSASLHRMLGMGKPVILTDIGTFSDYPEDIALKVRYDGHEVDDIYQAVCTLAKGKKLHLKRRSQAALRFAEENCDIQKNALRYTKFFNQIQTSTWEPDYGDVLVGRLCELGLTEKSYVNHVGSLLEQLGL